MNLAAPALQALPDGVVTLADHEAQAAARLDPPAWAYFSGGAGDEISLRANRAAWDDIALHPRVLQPLATASTAVRLLGKAHSSPLLLAPVAYQRLAHPDGELASAMAAAAQGAGMVLSTQSSVALEAVAQAVRAEPGRGPLWFQLYLQADRGVTLDLAARAEQAGYEALVITVDAPCSGARDRERRAGFRLPPGVSAVNLAPYGAQPEASLNAAPTWDDIAWLRARTRLPLLLKGVLHPADARQAAACGAAGVIVSNHGGRTLDTVPATACVLERIAQEVGGAMAVLVDGGIRRGTDIVKAMALGADAVLVGRPQVWGLANAGAVGVAHVLRLLRDELEIAMALCGCADLGRAGPELLWRPKP